MYQAVVRSRALLLLMAALVLTLIQPVLTAATFRIGTNDAYAEYTQAGDRVSADSDVTSAWRSNQASKSFFMV